MVTYLDKVLYLHPNIEGVMYWHTQYDGTHWADAYEGLVWENTEIAKPIKAELDALDDSVVAAELARRAEVKRKAVRDDQAKSNLTILAGYDTYKASNAIATLSDYLDYLEASV